MSEVSKQTSGSQRSSANSNGGNGGNNKKKDVAPPAKKGVTLNAEDEYVWTHSKTALYC
mgnify:CR=1 FL=1